MLPGIAPFDASILIIIILLFAILAGFTSPRQKWVAAANVLVATLALIIFGYNAVVGYSTDGPFTLTSIVRQALALIFFFALYYSSKTLRRIRNR
jgi:amino acid permease|tara:strand:+ start:31770 stop:32054 length:285 start_codon:yes stop_codon:yes gene_type:complete